MDEPRITGIRQPLRWLNQPADAEFGDRVTIHAPARTDWFIDPGGRPPETNSPALVGDLGGGANYQFSAKVTVDFKSTFDAGVLLLHAGDRSFAKLCFEYSPQDRPMIVSVVTRGESDDADGFHVNGNTVWLRVSRVAEDYFAFHASNGAQHWRIIRHFKLGADTEPAIGLAAQSPTGDGCTVTFEGITLRTETLADLRDGS